MPVAPEWHKEARRLHEETDLLQREIAARLGKSQASISRVLNPEATRAREASAERRAYKRKWNKENSHDTCECGRDKMCRHARCQACRINGERFKRRFSELLMIEMWRDGLNRTEIAREVGWSPRAVSARICHLRARGVDLPYRRVDADELGVRMRKLVKERVERQAAAK